MALPYHGDPEFLHMPVPVIQYQAALRVAMKALKIPLICGIEIGLGWGASAAAFLDFFKEGKLFSHDVNDWLPAKAVLEEKYPHRFKYMHAGDASMWANDICQWLYIDGDHSKDGVLRDIQQYLPRLCLGGVLCFDDYHEPSCPEVKIALDEWCFKNDVKLIEAGGPTGIVYWIKDKKTAWPI